MNVRLPILLFFLCFTQLLYTQNIFDLEHSHKYADHLFKTQNYSEAADEYERLINMSPDSIIYKERLIISYKLSGESEKCLLRIKDIFGNFSEDYPPLVINIYMQILIIQGEFEKCHQVFEIQTHLDLHENEEYRLAVYILEKDLKRAEKCIENYCSNIHEKKSTKFKQLAAIYNELINNEFKHPFVASILSVIIPGLGKAYANDFNNGALAFTVVGIYVWQSYNAFSTNGIRSVYGWGFGTLAVGFYIGNIYGSYKSAERENKFRDNEINKRVFNIILNNE